MPPNQRPASSPSDGDPPTSNEGSAGADGPPQVHGNRPTELPPWWKVPLWWIVLTFVLLWLWQETIVGLSVHTIPYSSFKRHLRAGEVVQAAIGPDDIEGRIEPHDEKKKSAGASEEGDASDAATGAASENQANAEASGPVDTNAEPESSPFGALAPRVRKPPPEPDGPFLFRTVRVEDPKLVDELEAHDVEFVGERPRMLTQFLLSWLLPIGIMFLLWGFIARKMAGAAGQALSFGKSRAKLVADEDTGVSFADVAGAEEAKQELQEVVEFLKTPQRYQALGAKIPKGVLLVGPPGTGKTLLARAVAGEAKVPFYSMSGSDFVEMFAGVGAARVRDLFEQAVKHAPCIIFIDEIDAIGRQRGVNMGVVNDEREQTLNQLLVEMDGFAPNNGVILLAATNRPDVLDRALLRPGRFDRQVVLDAPDQRGREAILRVHARGKPLADDVDLQIVAQATPGMSGADLANIMNEAALLAARRGHARIAQQDVLDAVEKVVAGPERKSRILSPEDKRRVAYHEVGHALVGHFSPGADPVQKISIVPRGTAALGYTLQLPVEDQLLLTESELRSKVRGLLGGRSAEEVVFDEVSSGAENDLERATGIVRQMITMLGMGKSVGLAHVARREGGPFLPGPYGGVVRDMSEATARDVDLEVKQTLEELHEEARQILRAHRDLLEALAQHLLETETLDRETFLRFVAPGDAPTPEPPAAGVRP